MCPEVDKSWLPPGPAQKEERHLRAIPKLSSTWIPGLWTATIKESSIQREESLDRNLRRQLLSRMDEHRREKSQRRSGVERKAFTAPRQRRKL